MTNAQFIATAISRWALRVATTLAILAATDYFAIGLGIAPENFKSPPAPIMIVAGLAYLIGGRLILIAHRRLMLAGAAANALVLLLLLFVVSAFTGNATIDALSLSGKAAQMVPGALLGWFVKRTGKNETERKCHLRAISPEASSKSRRASHKSADLWRWVTIRCWTPHATKPWRRILDKSTIHPLVNTRELGIGETDGFAVGGDADGVGGRAAEDVGEHGYEQIQG